MNGNQMFAIGIIIIGVSITALIYNIETEPKNMISGLDLFLGMQFIIGIIICLLSPLKLFEMHYTSRNEGKAT